MPGRNQPLGEPHGVNDDSRVHDGKSLYRRHLQKEDTRLSPRCLPEGRKCTVVQNFVMIYLSYIITAPASTRQMRGDNCKKPSAIAALPLENKFLHPSQR
jgi:hypothetical protein